MKKMNIAFIGAGHITEILTKNILKNGYSADCIYISDPNTERTEELSNTLKIQTALGNAEAIKGAEIIFICVHPHIVPYVIEDIRTLDLTNKIFISVSAGVPLSLYTSEINTIKAIRILPNPPSKIGEGAVPVAVNKNIDTFDKDKILPIIKVFGKCYQVGEDKIDIFTSLTSPAP
ncbi:MAG: NAD(P)-binding domain-containing protein, partial [Tannerellaceae bacterium]